MSKPSASEWTRDPPTAPGHYWLVTDAAGGPNRHGLPWTLVEVVPGPTGGLCVRQGTHAKRLGACKGWWCGPLSPPRPRPPRGIRRWNPETPEPPQGVQREP